MDNENKIEETGKPATISFFAHEAEVDRLERHIQRLFIALMVCIALLFASNVGWLIYESQFETVTATQDGGDINNVNVGTQGDVLNGADSQNQTQGDGQGQESQG